MTDPSTDRAAPVRRPAEPGAAVREVPGDRPPKRLLKQAPSERLAGRGDGSGASGTSRASAATRDGSAGRAAAFGLVAAAAGTLAHLVAATYLLWTGGLLVVAVTIGIGVGLAVALGAGSAMRARARRSLAVVLALGAIGLAIGANWATSGMYLGPLDYVVQVYGLLVPAQLALAAAGAVAGSR